MVKKTDNIDPKLKAKYLKLKKKIAEKTALLRHYEETNKIEFFVPLPHQEKVLDHIYKDKKRTILIVGANRIGKTVIGSVFVGAEISGDVRPWSKEPTLFGGKPIKVRIVCSDWEHHAAEVIVPKLKEWFSAGSYETKKNNVGVEAFWTFPKTKSTIELITHKMDTRQLEGWSGHIVWADEPLPHDKYIALIRGLVDNSGIFLLTMTAVTEPWILDEIATKNDSRIGITSGINIRENIYLKEEDVQWFADSLPENQKVARIQGGWLSLTGLVLPEFDRELHILKEAPKVGYTWPVTVMIDLHLRKEQALGFYATDPRGAVYVIDEIWRNMPPEQMADEIIRRKIDNSWNIKDVYIDPLSKGDSLYMKNRMDVLDSFTIIDDILRHRGIMLHVASKDKESGVRNVQDMLMGINKTPSLFFAPHCERHIWEIQRWKYDKDTTKPEKLNDDMMENLYRYTLTNPIMFSGDVYEKANKSVMAHATF